MSMTKPNPTTPNPPRRSHPTFRIVVVLMLVAIVLGGGWGAWRWITYPRAPDVRTADFTTVIGFMGTSDFGRMFKSSRASYASAVADRMFAMTLEKFYALPPSARTLLLEMIASARQTELDRHPDLYPAPTPQLLLRQTHRLMSHQPPRVQAMCVQFTLDLERAAGGA